MLHHDLAATQYRRVIDGCSGLHDLIPPLETVVRLVVAELHW